MHHTGYLHVRSISRASTSGGGAPTKRTAAQSDTFVPYQAPTYSTQGSTVTFADLTPWASADGCGVSCGCPLAACIEAITPLTDILERGVKLPLTCALHMVHMEPLC
ncbi:hypothetical protein LSAT2_000988 [Lamellibrachia satsuma]|nr:hypothetical protein LSAT2_000988 [Lamellibrachia satsuma]